MARLIPIGVLLLGLTVVGSCETGAAPVADPAPTVGTAAQTSKIEAVAVASAIGSLTSSPEELPATGSGVNPDQARKAFPPGTAVTAEPSTWSPDGTGAGGVMRVTVTSAGGQSQTYLAVMVNESGTWKVLATLPVTMTPGRTSQ